MRVWAFFRSLGTRDRGCSAHPTFPAPSIFEGGKEFASLGRNHAARSRTHTLSHVVPANAGTHTPRRMLLEKIGRELCFNNRRLWLWIPAFAGTTAEGFAASAQITPRTQGWPPITRRKSRSPGSAFVIARCAKYSDGASRCAFRHWRV